MEHKRLIFVPILVAAAAAALALAGDPGPLDGKRFEVHLVEDGQSEAQPDTLVFEGGTFDSTACREYGFGKAPYKAEKKGESWQFTVEAKSEKEGTNRWSGTISADGVEGTLVWSKPGQDDVRYKFWGKSAG